MGFEKKIQNKGKLIYNLEVMRNYLHKSEQIL